MGDILKKLNKIIDSVADAMVEQLPAYTETREYKYEDLSEYVKRMVSEHPQIKKFTVSITRVSEFEGKVFASDRFLIRIVMLNEDKTPLISEGKKDSYIGTVVIAEAIDTKMKDKMGGEATRTFKYSGGK